MHAIHLAYTKHISYETGHQNQTKVATNIGTRTSQLDTLYDVELRQTNRLEAERDGN
jgi:hypothetical protein